MTQVANYNVGPGPRATVRQAFNAVLAALRDGNAGPTAPPNPVPHMVWVDTSVDPLVIKRRNTANTEWSTEAAVMGFAGIASDIAPTVTNANTLSIGGRYFALGTATGVPNNSEAWIIDVLPANTTASAVQVAYGLTTGQIWRRVEANSTWAAWMRMLTASDIGTAPGNIPVLGAGGLIDAARVPRPSQAQSQDGAADNVFATPLSVEQHMLANALGWGQTPQDVTATRTHTTVYQNTTGRPITAYITTNGNSTTRRAIEISADGTTWLQVGIDQGAGSTATIIVPPNWRYRVNGATTILAWVEVR